MFLSSVIVVGGLIYGVKSLYQWAYDKGYNASQADENMIHKYQFEGLKDQVRELKKK